MIFNDNERHKKSKVRKILKEGPRMLKRNLLIVFIGFVGIFFLVLVAGATEKTCYWEIEKTAQPNELTLSPGQSIEVSYKIVVRGTGYNMGEMQCDGIIVDTNRPGNLDWYFHTSGGEQTVTKEYRAWIGPYEICGAKEAPNTASLLFGNPYAPDTTYFGPQVTHTLKVNVPCEGGCTLTPGYWKTHSKYGPAPYDNAWALVLPYGENTMFFNSGKTWYQVLTTVPKKGDAYYILAHAYIAAKLNELNNADTFVIASTLRNVEDWFKGLAGTNVPANRRTTFISTASILDQYNNGYVGPGHCSE